MWTYLCSKGGWGHGTSDGKPLLTVCRAGGLQRCRVGWAREGGPALGRGTEAFGAEVAWG